MFEMFLRMGTGRDRSSFLESMSLLAASGMTISEALAGVEADMRSGAMRRIVKGMGEDIDAGFPLSRALERSGMFSQHTISLVRVGEESGRLSENLRMISEQEKKERMIRSRVRSAAMYPVFVLGLTLVIGVCVAWFILPKLATVFSQLRIPLPLVSRMLIEGGLFLGAWGSVAIPTLFILIALVVYVLFFAPRTKYVGYSLLFATPGIHDLILESELTRFGYMLGSLLKAGLPVMQALSSLAAATEFPPYRRVYQHVAQRIEQGDSFEKAFKSYPRLHRFVPRAVQQLIVSGERSGKLSDALLAVSVAHEEKLETTTKDLSVILEPVLLVIVWIGVVAVAIAVILPIYSLVGGLQTS